jgi:L-type amino acid transporter 9
VTDTEPKTAITRLLGPWFGIVAATLICLVVAGSLLGNSFVASRMAVAAANKNWLPPPLALVGRIGATNPMVTRPDSPKPSASDAPINALLLSTVLSTLYILLGDFRSLITLNGIGEFSFFFLTVVAAIILRFREPDLHRPYKPFLIVPVTFAVVSGLVVIRGAAFAPVQAAVLIVVWVVGVIFYLARRAWARAVEE